MHLKRLEIHGFKSFYERTELEFRPGITAVVGPNGSGKSNVSDALLWVLGEQNARNLRGEGSADLIFAGTDKRRPLGLAEVSLSIDNADRGLPLDYSEVTITRRVYRSGEGEFFINRTPCRLKDIYELFLDTGVGRDAYSIISQNQIHAVLSARSEERRELLEEAAGIKKYRHRRKEAHRKLESTRQNLTRVDDILGELEVQVEPLEIQSRVAERWQELNARLRELEIGLLAVDLLRKSEELRHLQAEREGADRGVEALAARLAREEAAEHETRLELTRREGELENVRRSRDLAREEALKLEGDLNLARQQAVADASERMRLVAEQARWEARAEELEAESAALQAERQELDTRLNGLDRGLSEHAQAMEAARKRLRETTTALETLRRRQSDAAARRAALEEKSRQAESQIRDHSERMEREGKRLEELNAEIRAAEARETESRAETAAVREQLSRLQSDLAGIETEIKSGAQAHREAQAALKERQTQVMRLSARLRSLEEMHRSLEGVYRGVKAVIQAARAGNLAGEFRVVADLLTVPPEYALAMEVALGSHVQDIVCPRDREAQEAIRYLKGRNAGRATFLPLDLIRGDRMQAVTEMGIHGVAADLLEYPAEVRPAIDSLLGRILVVEEMQAAVNLVRSSRPGLRGARMVTLDGELIHPNGSLSGGSREGGPGILSRKVEIDRLTGEVEAETLRLQEEEKAAQAAGNALTRHESLRDSLRGEIASARVELAQRESQLDHAGREIRRLQRDREDAEHRVRIGQSLREETHAKRQEHAETLEKLHESLTRWSEEEEGALSALAHATEAVETVRATSSDLQLELAKAREQGNALEEQRRRLERTRKEVHAGREAAAESLAVLEERRGRTDGREENLSESLERRREAVKLLDAQLSQLTQDRTALMERLGEQAAGIKTLAQEREETLEKSHRLEVRETGLLSDVEHLQLRLLEDYEAEPDHAPMLAGAVTSRQTTAIEVNRLKREMQALGTVNLGAIEEYRRVSERVEFLSGQKADLEEAEATLLRVITEIDATTQEVFRATFEKVAAAFDEMFKKLFNGGRSQLTLTDPANVLETGIDIIVQPPGKKLQHLQLLSGGEKALTAVALLFALLEVKPSPFCLLDEVDAALDEANVGRFADVVKEFARRSQFIIITHNKATMAAADTLCGVTMEEPGVSKILSVKLED